MRPADYKAADRAALIRELELRIRELELRDKLITKLDAQLEHYDAWYGDDCPCGAAECPLATI